MADVKQPYSGIHRAWLHAALPAFVWERQFYPAVDDLHYDAAFGVPEGEKNMPISVWESIVVILVVGITIFLQD